MAKLVCFSIYRSGYMFSVHVCFGLSGVPKIQISRTMRHLQDLVDSGHEVVLEEDKPHLDYRVEKNPPNWSTEQPTVKYNYISEISRYSLIQDNFLCQIFAVVNLRVSLRKTNCIL